MPDPGGQHAVAEHDLGHPQRQQAAEHDRGDQCQRGPQQPSGEDVREPARDVAQLQHVVQHPERDQPEDRGRQRGAQRRGQRHGRAGGEPEREAAARGGAGVRGAGRAATVMRCSVTRPRWR
ncbi:hypothetical protein ACFQZ4_01105 [Catellatospora coxensis]